MEKTYSGAISRTLDTVPDTTANRTHRERTAEIVQDDIRAVTDVSSRQVIRGFPPVGFGGGDVPGVSSVISSRHDVLLDKKGPGDVSGQKSVFEIDFFPCSSVVDSQLWGSVSRWICVGVEGGDLKGDGFVMTRVMMTFWVLRVETRWKEKMGQKGRVE